MHNIWYLWLITVDYLEGWFSGKIEENTVFSGTSSKSLSEFSDMSYDKDCLEIM